MNLTKCAKGHFYDGEKYMICPHCAANLPAMESMITPQVIAPSESSFIGDSQEQPILNEVKPAPIDWSTFNWENPDPVILKKEEMYLSKVFRVIVYPSGTKIIRRVIFSPTEEKSTIYVTDIPQHRVDDVHIRVSSGLTCFPQASVYWVSEEKAKEVEADLKKAEAEGLKEENLCEKQMEDINIQSNYLMEQFEMWEMIKKNCLKKLKTKKNCNVEEESAKLMQIVERQHHLRKQLIEYKNKMEQLTEENEEKTDVKKLKDYGEKCLKLILLAEPGQSYCIDIEYESYEATWTPAYEIHVESARNQASVYLYAKINKTSEESWEDVDLTVSTGIAQIFNPYILKELKPMVVMAAPKELPYGDSIEENPEYTHMELNPTAPLAAPRPEPAEADTPIDFDIEHTFNPEPIEIKETATSVRHEYHLQDRISLSQNSKEKMIIWKQDIDVQPYYFAVPKNDSAEYMAIRLTELQKFDVLACNAKVYLDGEYTRELFLRQEELDKQVVLGRAKGVTVKRSLRKNEQNEKKLQGKIIQSYEYVIRVTNELKYPIRLHVLDCIPITSDPDVQIEVKTSSGADINPGTGVCTWNVSLEAEKNCNLELCYTITHPSKQNYECI